MFTNKIATDNNTQMTESEYATKLNDSLDMVMCTLDDDDRAQRLLEILTAVSKMPAVAKEVIAHHRTLYANHRPA